jgi:uncharacterized protein YoxC
MATVKLDGLEIDLPAEAATAVQSFARDMERQLKSVTTERDTLQSKLDTAQEDVETLAYDKETADQQVTELQARVDELETAAKDPANAPRLDTAEIDKLVHERMEVINTLSPLFAEDFKFDGVDNQSLFNQAYETITGQAPPEDAAPAAVNGVVQGYLLARSEADADDSEGDDEGDEGRSDHAAAFRKNINVTAKNSQRSDARGTYHAKQADAWKRPLTAHK